LAIRAAQATQRDARPTLDEARAAAESAYVAKCARLTAAWRTR
jgi:hypothetical protein